MKILYFAWLREKAGIGEEDVSPPETVTTVAELVEWKKSRGGGYAEAFADEGMVRVAGYSAANPSAVAECLTDEVKRALHLDDLDYAEGLDFWKLPPRIGKYVEVWNEILAAE